MAKLGAPGRAPKAGAAVSVMADHDATLAGDAKRALSVASVAVSQLSALSNLISPGSPPRGAATPGGARGFLHVSLPSPDGLDEGGPADEEAPLASEEANKKQQLATRAVQLMISYLKHGPGPRA